MPRTRMFQNLRHREPSPPPSPSPSPLPSPPHDGPIPYDPYIFDSPQAYKRYMDAFNSKKKKKRIVPEKGFEITFDQHPVFRDEIKARQWRDFCAAPGPACPSLVRLFYANFPETLDDYVHVQSKLVNYVDQTINDFYNLPNISHHHFISLQEGTDWNEIADFLCDGHPFGLQCLPRWLLSMHLCLTLPECGIILCVLSWSWVLTSPLSLRPG